MNVFRTILLGSMLPVALSGCAAPLSYADAQATAQVAGCWPGNGPTPPAVTVTPAAPTSSAPIEPGTPTATRLPTTTPYPRCTPVPGAPTLIPYPTPLPTRPAYPTMEPQLIHGGSSGQTVLQLPGVLLTIDLAVHPTEGWPAVAALLWPGVTRDPRQAFVRVMDPRTQIWGPAQQLDVGPASSGTDRFANVVLAITGDRAVHAVWGASDADHTDGDPPSAIWASASTDLGRTWSAPRRIATHCFIPADMAATADGQIVVLAVCPTLDDRAVEPAMIVRSADGVWGAAQRLGVPIWYYSEGSVAIVGGGAEAHAVALVLAGEATPTAILISRRLSDAAGWQVEQHPVALPDGQPPGLRMWHPRSLVFARHQAGGATQPGIAFVWTGAEVAGAYALVSLDGGRTWGPIEPIVWPAYGDGRVITFVAPAYEPVADRLVALWTCCADAQWQVVESTHYASWSTPGSGVWHTHASAAAASPVPLVLGSRVAHDTAAAQAANSRSAWVAWVEQQYQLVARTLDLNQIVPAELDATPMAGGSQ
jgi:hypothetical protein